MSITELKTTQETDFTIKNQLSPSGKVILYIFQDGTPVHSVLVENLKKNAKKKLNCKFFMVDSENLDPIFCEKHKIVSFPLFFMIKDGKIEKKLEIETGTKNNTSYP
eukprot:gene9199-1285_t